MTLSIVEKVSTRRIFDIIERNLISPSRGITVSHTLETNVITLKVLDKTLILTVTEVKEK